MLLRRICVESDSLARPRTSSRGHLFRLTLYSARCSKQRSSLFSTPEVCIELEGAEAQQ
jgi:hypothetical protein